MILYNIQQERDRLLAEVESLAATSDGQRQKVQDVHAQKLKALEAQVTVCFLQLYQQSWTCVLVEIIRKPIICELQILDLKKKQENQVQLLKQKQKSDEATKRLQDEIQSIKAQKVGSQSCALVDSDILIIINSFSYVLRIDPAITLLQVQLQHKIKQEAEQFRQWKASREKELLQVLHFLFSMN